MSRLARTVVSMAVACTLLAGTLVPAQGPQVNEQRTTTVEKKVVVEQQERLFREAKERVLILQRRANPLAPHILQQLRPILRAEYHFLRSVCDLTDQQRKQIAPKSEEALEKAAEELAALQGNSGRTVEIGSSKDADPRAIVQAKLREVATPFLSPTQVTRYLDELENRNEFRKQAEIENLVARLDQELTLSPDQRTKIGAVLNANWTSGWFPSVELYLFQNNQSAPPLASTLIIPILTPQQRTVWDSMPRNQVFFPLGYVVNNPVDNTSLNDADFREQLPVQEVNGPPVLAPAVKARAR